MNVLFINASKLWEGRTYREYPYGVGILATLANHAGYKVQILDMAVDVHAYLDVVAEFLPDVIAISFLSPSVTVAAEVIRTIKKEFQGPILAGGIHSTLYPDSVLEYGADIVIQGEGELTFVSILNTLRDTSGLERDRALEMIPGLVFRDTKKQIRRTQRQSLSVDLDTLPIMNRSLFHLELYAHHTILTSRCCPYGCRFCCSWAPGGKVGRIMSPDRILRELDWLVSQYGPLTLYWGDEIFFWNREDRLSFCQLLKKRKLPIQFIIQLRADLVEPELITQLIEVGCLKVCIGAESGSDQLLQMANKRIKAIQIENAIDICVKAGIPCKTWWMVGLPGGRKEDQLKALDIIDRTRPNEVAVHQFIPLPGSVFWEDAEKYGIRLPDESSFENLNYYSNPEKLSYDYISASELKEILLEYQRRLLDMGYVPTDLADETASHVFTTPFQDTTFNI